MVLFRYDYGYRPQLLVLMQYSIESIRSKKLCGRRNVNTEGACLRCTCQKSIGWFKSMNIL
jgi:hypothetical protein